MFAVSLTKRVAPSFSATAILGCCTLVLPYAHCTFDAMPTAFFLLLSFYLAWRASNVGRALTQFGAGCAMAAAVLIRVDSLIVIAPLSCWMLWRFGFERRSRDPRALLTIFAPVAVALLITGWYDIARLGSWLNNGHAHDPQTRAITPLWYGLVGILASPGKGLLFFAPPFLLALLGWKKFLGEQPALGLSVVSGAAAYVLFVSRLANWSGAEAWGPRFLVPTFALVMLPLPGLLSGWSRFSRIAKAWVLVLCAGGLAVQIAGASVWATAIDRLHGPLQAAAFHKSEILYAWKALWRGMRGGTPYPSTLHGGIVPPPVPHLDFWWMGGYTGAIGHRVLALMVAAALGATVIVAGARLYRIVPQKLAAEQPLPVARL